ncbi:MULTISPECIES: cystathionine gamma-synthase [unclassified Parafrankia]|uniref:cystathionine gamma-synthase n=1 Tax=unclassified Parafrankia TaxID=2994368 RepID=UPI000DA5B5D5|nr:MULTISPECIES: cystathionine gamma-synthase [unclassified Parafrankia]TCJ38604.1 cystathionine gamma-synthase [Parafrankia sp. BMG5.11]CAI7981176.1 cystathionine gamma-lyase and homocysteine gamma-lyase for reverse transsulfuration pathway (PLP-dependent) [Frankia sp. Hr75.2]SQD95900.1 cystathionine gamma-lyase and homocysteine gamma-lyase for reverse transsulfuration pathway [Parafrankia sp. Ea1.12]
MGDRNAGFETVAVHAGQEPDPATGAVVVPIHPASTFAQDGVGGLRAGFEYARSGNPTRAALEASLTALERGAAALAFASGLAASDALLRAVCRPGSHVVIPGDAYGGTYRLFARVLAEWGVEHTAVDLSDPAAAVAAIRPGATALVWCETPTNPMLAIADIAALAAVAHQAGALLVVDNTFASPYLCQPLTLGADAVVHSTTKYLGGHSDVVGGAVVTASAELAERVRFVQNAAGAVPGPFDAWLVLRGIRTLAVRMDRHCANAREIAALLAGHTAVSAVHYPGLASHPGHDVAAKQMRDFGGMVSFQVRAGAEAALAVCAATRLFTLAESLGGVESLIEHPARMTHASVAGSPLAVPDDLVRLSVGIEAADDLVADLEQALDSA